MEPPQTCKKLDISFTPNELLKQMKSTWWLLLMVIFLIELLMGVITIVTESSYLAEATVVLGRVKGKSAGVQEVVVERVRKEHSDEYMLDLLIKPEGKVYIAAEGVDAESAVTSAEQVLEKLISYNRDMLEKYVEKNKRQIKGMQVRIDQMDKQISALLESMKDTRNGGSLPIGVLAAKEIAWQIDARYDLWWELDEIENHTYDDVFESVILAGPKVLSEPVRPRWKRNLTVGLLIGFILGLFICFLLALFRLIETPESAEA